MKAMIVIKVANGYALLPFSGELPRDNMESMQIEKQIDTYSYGDCVAKALRAYFEPIKDEPSLPAPVAEPVEEPL